MTDMDDQQISGNFRFFPPEISELTTLVGLSELNFNMRLL